MTDQSNSLSLNLNGLEKDKNSQYGSCQENIGMERAEAMEAMGEQPVRPMTTESQMSGEMPLGQI